MFIHHSQNKLSKISVSFSLLPNLLEIEEKSEIHALGLIPYSVYTQPTASTRLRPLQRKQNLLQITVDTPPPYWFQGLVHHLSVITPRKVSGMQGICTSYFRNEINIKPAKLYIYSRKPTFSVLPSFLKQILFFREILCSWQNWVEST